MSGGRFRVLGSGLGFVEDWGLEGKGYRRSVGSCCGFLVSFIFYNFVIFFKFLFILMLVDFLD